MPYEIDLIEGEKIIFLRFYGEVPAGDHILVRNVVLDLMKTRKINRVLICWKEAVLKTSSSEEFLITSALKDLVPPNTRIATVVPADNQFIEHHRFAETVCFNRAVNLRLFPDYDEAKKWLTG